MNKTGELLAKLRKEKGLTQQQVADALHITNKTVSKWECGEGLPEVGMLSDVAALYGISVDELLRGERYQSYIETGQFAQISQDRFIQGKRITQAILLIGIILYIGIEVLFWLLIDRSVPLMPNIVSVILLLIDFIIAALYFMSVVQRAKRNQVDSLLIKQVTSKIVLNAVMVVIMAIAGWIGFMAYHFQYIEKQYYDIFGLLSEIGFSKGEFGLPISTSGSMPLSYYLIEYVRVLPISLSIVLIVYFIGECIIEHKKTKRIWLIPAFIVLFAGTCIITNFTRIERIQYTYQENYDAYVKQYGKAYRKADREIGLLPDLPDLTQDFDINPYRVNKYIDENEEYSKFKNVTAFRPQKLQVWILRENQVGITWIRNGILMVIGIAGIIFWEIIKKKEEALHLSELTGK